MVPLSRALAIVVVLALPAPVSAYEDAAPDGEIEEERRTWSFNLSGVIGGGTITPSDTFAIFAIGFRPEVFLPRTEAWPGVGLYLEVGSSGDLYYGSGLSLTIPLSGNFHLAPSVGVAGWDFGGVTQLSGVASLFIGNRMFNPITAFDATFGLRFDARYGAEDGLWSFTAQVAIDLTILAALLAWA